MLPLFLPGVQVQPAPKVTLADILAQARWNVAERGPLIVVGAEKIFSKKNAAITPGATFSQSLPCFGRKLVRCGGVWAVVPERIPGYPDIRGLTAETLAARSQHQAFVNLLMALDVAAWKKLGQGNGLGREDLPPKIQPLFDALMPEGTEVEVLEGMEAPEHVPLTPNQRTGVRLNLRWAGSWSLPAEDGMDADMVSVQDSTMVIPSSSGVECDYYLEYRNTRQAPLKRTEILNNQVKTGDLNFEVWEQPLSLEGIRTVKDLIARAARVTGLELYSDARVEKFSVATLGRQARTGDVLKALCYALGGTFRQVGNTYLLTENQKPDAVLMRDILELDSRAWKLQENSVERLKRHLERNAKNFRAAITPLRGEPHPDQLARLGEKKPDSEWMVSTVQLPENLQQRTRELAVNFAREVDKGEEKFTSKNRSVTRVRTDRARIQPELAIWIQVPFSPTLQMPIYGHKQALQEGLLKDAWPLGAETVPEPAIPAELNHAVRWPVSWKKRSLRITPRSAQDAEVLAYAAKKAGLTELWVEVPTNPERAKPLLAAVAKSGLVVLAIIRPLVRSVGSEGDGLQYDLLPTGETTDAASVRQNNALPEGIPVEPLRPRYLFPTVEAIEPVMEIAGFSQVQGVVLEEVNTLEGGCLVSLRQEFVRQYHVDPCDLGTPLPADHTQERFFKHPDEPDKTWPTFRAGYLQRWQALLGTRLKAAMEQKPVWVQVEKWGNREFQLWADPKRLPMFSKQSIEVFDIDKSVNPTRMRAFLNARARTSKLEHLLITLRDEDTETLVRYLEAISPKTPD